MVLLYYEMANGDIFVREYHDSIGHDFSYDFYVNNCKKIIIDYGDKVLIKYPNYNYEIVEDSISSIDWFMIKMRATNIPPIPVSL